MPSYSTLRRRKKRLELEILHGQGCSNPKCRATNGLEFAHLEKTSLNGEERSSDRRLKNIENNPKKYILLCKNCHKKMDDKAKHYVFTPDGTFKKILTFA